MLLRARIRRKRRTRDRHRDAPGRRLLTHTGWRRRTGTLSAIHQVQIHRHAFHIKLCQRAQKMRHRWLARHRKRLGEMRAVFQNAANHAAARITRPDLDKGLHPRRVGRADHAWKIDRGQRLRFNRIGGGVIIGRVGAAPGSAVKLNLSGRSGGRVVQRAVGAAHRMRQFAMHRAHALQRKPVAAQRRDHFINLHAVTADYAFIAAVDDDHVHAAARANRAAHRLDPAIHHAGDPRNALLRRQLPGGAQYVRHTSQIMRKQG